MAEKFLCKLEEIVRGKGLSDIDGYVSKEYLDELKTEHKERIREIVNYRKIKVAFYISQVEDKFNELTDNAQIFQHGMADMDRLEKQIAELDTAKQDIDMVLQREQKINEQVKKQLEAKIDSITKIYDEKNEEYNAFNRQLKVQMK